MANAASVNGTIRRGAITAFLRRANIRDIRDERASMILDFTIAADS
jgi:hypothetical protein